MADSYEACTTMHFAIHYYKGYYVQMAHNY